MKGKRRRQYPFRRKKEETPYEAMERLDKKLAKAEQELGHWKFRLGLFAQNAADNIGKEIRILKSERAKLVQEIEERHRGLLKASPGANVISV